MTNKSVSSKKTVQKSLTRRQSAKVSTKNHDSNVCSANSAVECGECKLPPADGFRCVAKCEQTGSRCNRAAMTDDEVCKQHENTKAETFCVICFTNRPGFGNTVCDECLVQKPETEFTGHQPNWEKKFEPSTNGSEVWSYTEPNNSECGPFLNEHQVEQDKCAYHAINNYFGKQVVSPSILKDVYSKIVNDKSFSQWMSLLSREISQFNIPSESKKILCDPKTMKNMILSCGQSDINVVVQMFLLMFRPTKISETEYNITCHRVTTLKFLELDRTVLSTVKNMLLGEDFECSARQIGHAVVLKKSSAKCKFGERWFKVDSQQGFQEMMTKNKFDKIEKCFVTYANSDPFALFTLKLTSN